MFDYEYATVMHHWKRALGDARPGAEVPFRVGICGATESARPKLVRYPGLKEEYYLADHVFDPEVIPELGLDPSRVIAVLRPPPEVTLYHPRSVERRVLGNARSPAGGGTRGANRRLCREPPTSEPSLVGERRDRS